MCATTPVQPYKATYFGESIKSFKLLSNFDLNSLILVENQSPGTKNQVTVDKVVDKICNLK